MLARIACVAWSRRSAAADRVRQHCQPSTRTRPGPKTRNGHSCGVGRWKTSSGAPAAHRKPDPGSCRNFSWVDTRIRVSRSAKARRCWCNTTGQRNRSAAGSMLRDAGGCQRGCALVRTCACSAGGPAGYRIRVTRKRQRHGRRPRDSTLCATSWLSDNSALLSYCLPGRVCYCDAFYELLHTDRGFSTEHVLTLQTALSGTEPAKADLAATVYGPELDSIRQLPGVQSAGFVTFLPLGNGHATASFHIGSTPDARPGQRSSCCAQRR